MPPELVRRIDAQTSSRAAPGNGYGLTETSGAAIANFGPAYVANPESVGKPISPVIDVRIVAGDGNDAAVGEVGEIWLKGPTVVRGYLGRDARRPRRSPTAGSTPATSAASTPTATSTSSTG